MVDRNDSRPGDGTREGLPRSPTGPAGRVEPDGSPRVVETHISRLVFEAELVHKHKKPVHFAFVDMRTPEQREEMCRREVELNRRLSPDVYLGVEEIRDGTGAVVDHAVLMRRMPEQRRLATLVRTSPAAAQHVRDVARVMAAFHSRARRSTEIAAVARPGALLDLWRGNLAEIRALPVAAQHAAALEHIEVLATEYISGRSDLLAERIAGGHIVDGHGDLLADDIFCLDDGPRILDCLEFDDHLRWGDVLYDAGFLAMDLERLGRDDLATAFLDAYREYSAETHPRSLAHHYVAYRALVRAKIDLLGGQSRPATDHLEQCHRHLLDARVRLVVVGGLPGTGKTTLALALADRLECAVLRTDEIRKELAGRGALDHAPAPFGEGLYAPALTDATYETLLDRATVLLTRGESVILDAAFASAKWRAAAARVAQATSTELVQLRCDVPTDEARARLRARAARGNDASDADATIAARMAEHFDAWDEATTVTTLDPPATLANRICGSLGLGPSANQHDPA